nr:hypothetical protein BaRGS_028571 [Batillaria attramentaria]
MAVASRQAKEEVAKLVGKVKEQIQVIGKLLDRLECDGRELSCKKQEVTRDVNWRYDTAVAWLTQARDEVLHDVTAREETSQRDIEADKMSARGTMERLSAVQARASLMNDSNLDLVLLKNGMQSALMSDDALEQHRSRAAVENTDCSFACESAASLFDLHIAQQYIGKLRSVGTRGGSTTPEVRYSEGGGYDPKTGIFTVPVTGTYVFLATIGQGGSATTGVQAEKKTCQNHPDQLLCFFCQKCDVSICLHCKLTSHEGHVTVDMAVASRQAKEEVAKLVGKVKDQIQVIGKLLDRLDRDGPELSCKKQDVTRDVNWRYDTAIAWLTQARDEVLHDVTAREETIQRDIEAEKISARGKMERLSAVQARASHMNDSNLDLVLLKNDMQSALMSDDALEQHRSRAAVENTDSSFACWNDVGWRDPNMYTPNLDRTRSAILSGYFPYHIGRQRERTISEETKQSAGKMQGNIQRLMHAVDWFPTVMSLVGGMALGRCICMAGLGDWKLIEGSPGDFNDWYPPPDDDVGQTTAIHDAEDTVSARQLRLFNIKG